MNSINKKHGFTLLESCSYMVHMFPVDLPRGAEWMIKGADTPSLRVQTAPFGSIAFGYQVQVHQNMVDYG